MRTCSTPQSALDGEITKLAIIETVASATLYVGLGVYFGTFKYLAVAVVFAPLMLFRTEVSSDWGLKKYTQISDFFNDWLPQLPKRLEFLGFILVLILLPVVGTAIRISATIYWLVRRPLQTLRDVPRNWLRQCFCTDFAHPPEIVPKEALADSPNILRFTVLSEFFRTETTAEGIAAIVLASPLLLLGWIPSVIYRVSFKATSLAYIPFVWVSHATLRNLLPVKARLERFTKGELEKVRRGISYVVLTTLVAKGALVFNWIERAKVEAMFPSQKIVTDFVVLDAWPWWQITFAADAILTFALLYFADAALSRIDAERPWREESVKTTVAAISFLRASFAVITIAHFFLSALVAAAPKWARPLLTF